MFYANALNAKIFPFISGSLMTANFLLFWGLPIMGMGQLWKLGLKTPLTRIYDLVDQNSFLRSFASKYIYAKPEHSDYFAVSIFVFLSTVLSLGIVFYCQLKYYTLPWWLIALYYCTWVGFGGRTFGSAYTLAHKEGHNKNFYSRNLRPYLGHLFENHLGIFFGNVPWNFTTSHIFIHHKLDGGVGDTFYEWDLNRSSLIDFMLYVHRIFLHCVGYSSLKFFNAHNDEVRANLLVSGIFMYWVAALIILAITRSFSFLFWIYLQPMLCMSYFLALLNIGFHGFIEFDENGVNIPCINSTTIIDGTDDSFGEDDHMAHHYNTSVYYRDLPKLQQSKIEEFKKYKASVFQKLSIVELSIFIILGLWDKLAEHYVDYSGKMSKEEIMQLLKERAQRKETTYEEYQKYLSNPTLDIRKSLKVKSQLKNSNKSE